jgi:hypothetical protein
MLHGIEYIPEITMEEVREFVEIQMDDPILSLDLDNDVAIYVSKHLEILHKLILGDVTVDDATKQLGRLTL